MNNTQNSKLRDAIVVAQSLRRCPAFSIQHTNQRNVSLCQLGSVMRFAARKSFWMRLPSRRVAFRLSSLADTVLPVVVQGSEPEVQRIRTCRDIAVMAGQQARWDAHAMPHLIDNTSDRTGNMAVYIRKSKFSVAILIHAFQPGPTAVHTRLFMATLLNITPETLKKRGDRLHAMLMLVAPDKRIPTDTTIAVFAIEIASVIAKFIKGFRNVAANTGLHRAGSFIRRVSSRRVLSGKEVMKLPGSMPFYRSVGV